ncbi:hypothetical protein AB4Z30_19315 [Paenibacillus sp. 2TAF8]|uniref:hypothetical protein n=1 Tax=Paenibacillus sp. 2TAF8 TaxID=3233020 RepID=UPI003F9501BF
MKKRSILFAALCIAVAMIGMGIQKTKTENLETGVSSYPAIRPVIADQTTSPSINHTRGSIGENVTGGAVVQKHFTIDKGYGHIELTMENYSSQAVSVSLTHNYTGKVYFSREIPGMGALTWRNFEQGYEMGLRGGDYTLQWSGGGSEVNGKFTGRTSSSVSDFTVQ